MKLDITAFEKALSQLEKVSNFSIRT